MSDGGNTIPRIVKSEHVGPSDTGDNIEAKRTANYVWNGSAWERQSSSPSNLRVSGTDISEENPLPVDIKSGLMPSGTILTTYSIRITTNTTTTPISSTAYISCVVISAEVAGTSSSITIQDKSGTPLKLINGLATVSVGTTPTTVNFQTPIKMFGGIDIITAGVAAATVDVWINYYA